MAAYQHDITGLEIIAIKVHKNKIYFIQKRDEYEHAQVNRFFRIMNNFENQVIIKQCLKDHFKYTSKRDI